MRNKREGQRKFLDKASLIGLLKTCDKASKLKYTYCLVYFRPSNVVILPEIYFN